MTKFIYQINKRGAEVYHGTVNHIISNPLNIQKQTGFISFNVEDGNHLFICEDGTYEIGGDGSITLFLNPSSEDLDDIHSKADGYLDSIECMKGEANYEE